VRKELLSLNTAFLRSCLWSPVRVPHPVAVIGAVLLGTFAAGRLIGARGRGQWIRAGLIMFASSFVQSMALLMAIRPQILVGGA